MAKKRCTPWKLVHSTWVRRCGRATAEISARRRGDFVVIVFRPPNHAFQEVSTLVAAKAQAMVLMKHAWR